jgi:uncharacterized protein YoxC
MPPNSPISVINLAARQRMLSQRMILQTVLAANGHSAQLDAAENTFQLFCDSQTSLRAAVGGFDEPSARQLRETYEGPRGVGKVIEQFMQHMRDALHCIAHNSTRTQAAMDRLVASTDPVLEALNTVTLAFDNIFKGKSDLLLKELTGIVSDIQTVAREAKVVSFNAQVMAARAGQHGREFAVVANVLSGITNEIDGLSRKAVDLAVRNRKVA